MVSELLQKCDLDAVACKMTRLLTADQKRRLALAIALIGSPKILILDEPTKGMSPETKIKLQRAILHYGKKSATLLTTISSEEVQVLHNKIGFVIDGQIELFGNFNSLLAEMSSGYEVQLIMNLREIKSHLVKKPNLGLTRDSLVDEMIEVEEKPVVRLLPEIIEYLT
jgi:ABC-type multidrug transport system ATPase subunit